MSQLKFYASIVLIVFNVLLYADDARDRHDVELMIELYGHAGILELDGVDIEFGQFVIEAGIEKQFHENIGGGFEFELNFSDTRPDDYYYYYPDDEFVESVEFEVRPFLKLYHTKELTSTLKAGISHTESSWIHWAFPDVDFSMFKYFFEYRVDMDIWLSDNVSLNLFGGLRNQHTDINVDDIPIDFGDGSSLATFIGFEPRLHFNKWHELYFNFKWIREHEDSVATEAYYNEFGEWKSYPTSSVHEEKNIYQWGFGYECNINEQLKMGCGVFVENTDHYDTVLFHIQATFFF